jgi:hypothetical protein
VGTYARNLEVPSGNGVATAQGMRTHIACSPPAVASQVRRSACSGYRPYVDDLLAAVKGAAGSAQLVSPNKVLRERLAYDLKAAADVPLNI